MALTCDEISTLTAGDRRPIFKTPRWQSMETAPKDGTPVLGYSTEGVSYVCWHRKGSWIFFKNHRGDEWGFDPTHWMPLPAPPQA